MGSGVASQFHCDRLPQPDWWIPVDFHTIAFPYRFENMRNRLSVSGYIYPAIFAVIRGRLNGFSQIIQHGLVLITSLFENMFIRRPICFFLTDLDKKKVRFFRLFYVEKIFFGYFFLIFRHFSCSLLTHPVLLTYDFSYDCCSAENLFVRTTGCLKIRTY